MGKSFLVLFLLNCLFFTTIFSANILVLYPGSGKSHKIAVMPILEELAERGHQITIVSPYPTTAKSTNIRDIVLTDSADFINQTPLQRFEAQKVGILHQFLMLAQEILAPVRIGYESMMKNVEFQQILKDRQIDLVIHDGLFSEYCRLISHHLKVPFIEHSSSAFANTIDLSYMGATRDYATVPMVMSGFDDKMTFFQRMFNMFQIELGELFYRFLILRSIDQMVLKDFPNAPWVEELGKKTSLIIINSHPVIAWPRSLPPTVVSIGALHTRPAKLLPKELETFVADSENGFILFTLGSMIPGSSIPKETFQSFMNVFANLPQKVVWKWEDEVPENLPKNIFMSKWLPQQDLLGHPKAELFITHGGLQGTLEAIYHSVPLLCLPLGADQTHNCVKARKEGYAVLIDWNHISDETLKEGIKQLINNSRFKNNAKRVSSLIKDELIPGKDVGAYWVEYVLRHNGTKHLQSASKDVPFYRYYLLDVFAILFLIVLVVLYFTYRSFRWIICKCFPRPSTKKIKTQ